MNTYPTLGDTDVYPCILQQSLTDNVSNLLVLHQNIRSVNKNLHDFEILLQEVKTQVHVIGLTECWLQAGMDITIAKYNSFQSVRYSNKAGGVVLLFAEELHCELLNFDVSDSCDCVIVRVSDCTRIGKSIIFCLVYRSPNLEVSDFLSMLPRLFSFLASFKDLVGFMGDMNINVADLTSLSTNLLISHASAFGLMQIISSPTRVSNCSSTIIDLIFTNLQAADLQAGNVLSSITDHFTTYMNVSNYFGKSTVGDNTAIFKNIDYISVSQRLSSYNWDMVFSTSNTNLKVDMFITIINNLIKAYTKFDCKRRQFKNPINPWITPAILVSIRKRNRLNYKSKHHLDNIHLRLRYVNYRNKLNSIISASKKMYFVKELKGCVGNSKKTWGILNSITSSFRPGKARMGATCNNLVINNVKVTNPVEISNCFSGVFGNASSMVHNWMPRSQSFNINSASCYLEPVTSQETLNIMRNINYEVKAGHDCIVPRVIKDNMVSLVPVFMDIANSMLVHGIFPSAAKFSIITPIFKSGASNDPSNYRPIANITIIGKFLETVLKTRMLNFINKHNLISKNQHGFFAARSTNTALLDVVTALNDNANNGNITYLLSLDVSKAFDSISHNLLISKLIRMGFRGKIADILTSYLKDRYTITCCNGVFSSPVNMLNGVAQGSVLGPLLFILYVNDVLGIASDSIKITMYADDLLIYNLGLVDISFFQCAVDEFVFWYSNNYFLINAKKE